MSNTAVAVVTVDANGKAVAGTACYLNAPSLVGGFLFAITNNDGYALWPSVPVPFSGTLQLTGAAKAYGPNGNGEPVTVNGVNVTIRVGPSPANPQDVILPACVPFKKPFQIAPRFWKGNMCGVRVPGAPPVPGGADDPSLILSWFYDRYDALWRETIRQAWQARGLTHVLLSWPDSAASGATPESFQATCDELTDAGFFPCVFLSSKVYDPTDAPGILANIARVLPLLVGRVSLFCVGWELSLWLTPQTVQQLIDALAPQITPSGARLYVHFQEGYSSFQVTPGTFADFWNLQVGKLTGVLHQKVLTQTPDQYRYDSGGLNDVLLRFNGGFNCSPDSGFGHPFDIVALEITAQDQFFGTVTEAQGNALGTWAIETPAQMGPLGPVSVQGSGNGLQ